MAVLEPWWPTLVVAGGVLSVGLVVATVFGLPWVLCGLPQSFLIEEPPAPPLKVRLVRNGIGFVLLLLGIAMLVLPGQGLITMLAALVLLDVPGKRAVLVRALRAGPVLRTVNQLRERRGHPPLSLP